jgi:ABC-type bacteriocin/lantibiotic exporter with double-glycine peptidase domain
VRRRRLLAPEVIQTSAMDCGPAALKGLLAGFDIGVDYGRLRDACYTTVDGTSINTLEELANLIGLKAEQVILPPEHILLPEASALPAIVVMRLPNGFTHFVVAWRRLGRWVQIMDPAVGRRWITQQDFLANVYRHAMSLPVDDFRSWARTDEFRASILRRFANLGIGDAGAGWLADAEASGDWIRLAELDAAARLGDSLSGRGSVRRGPELESVLDALLADRPGAARSAVSGIPEAFWSIRQSNTQDRSATVRVRGAVLVRVLSCESPPPAVEQNETPARRAVRSMTANTRGALKGLVALLREEGWIAPTAVSAGLIVSAATLVLEALLFRGLVGLGEQLGTAQQRGVGILLIIAFSSLLLLNEFGLSRELARLGRHLEIRLRLAFLTKIPRLGDGYIQSRTVSDMAERGHAIHKLRPLPSVVGQILRGVVQILLTVAAIVWASPVMLLPALTGGLLAILIPLGFQASLNERDLRLRTHAGALCRFYFDALLGLHAIRAHRAERVVREEHEALLVQWGTANTALVQRSVVIDACQMIAGFAVAAWLVSASVSSTEATAGVLLLTYWIMTLPSLGSDVVEQLRRLAAGRSTMLRLLEPLDATERETLSASSPFDDRRQPLHGVEITFDAVTVIASAQPILKEINLKIEAGNHVAVVGASGAGKSTLLGVLLGWHKVANGHVMIDGRLFDENELDALRGATAWIDPTVHLWNASMLENLRFGANAGLTDIRQRIAEADLESLIHRLPNGLHTPVGEGGRSVSGGEGQRLRFGRGLGRVDARLVILDEAFRGLERPSRMTLLARARETWSAATLLCVTHDISETLDFDRVLVMQNGTIVEDGKPSDLASDARTKYSELLVSERSITERWWGDARWRRIWLESGELRESGTAKEWTIS